jgi:hypothetical protein
VHVYVAVEELHQTLDVSCFEGEKKKTYPYSRIVRSKPEDDVTSCRDNDGVPHHRNAGERVLVPIPDAEATGYDLSFGMLVDSFETEVRDR